MRHYNMESLASTSTQKLNKVCSTSTHNSGDIKSMHFIDLLHSFQENKSHSLLLII